MYNGVLIPLSNIIQLNPILTVIISYNCDIIISHCKSYLKSLVTASNLTIIETDNTVVVPLHTPPIHSYLNKLQLIIKLQLPL